MRDIRDAKAMARTLREDLARRGLEIGHGEALELVARQFGARDWNLLAATLAEGTGQGGRGDAVAFHGTAPILRIFDEEKAREFYLGFLGFTLDWEHRFGANFPLYCQVSRAGLRLHLSGHHGDASPGSTCFVEVRGIRAYQRELSAKDYRHMKPGVEELPWGLVMEVTDPFSNRIRFREEVEA